MILVAEGPYSTEYFASFCMVVLWVSALLANIVSVAVQFAYRYRFVCLKYRTC